MGEYTKQLWTPAKHFLRASYIQAWIDGPVTKAIETGLKIEYRLPLVYSISTKLVYHRENFQKQRTAGTGCWPGPMPKSLKTGLKM